ncbi:TPA: hypothetical protein DEP94_03760, partial [Candidatus Nomurabacteria bacterium]|nr:hypothetical protein [Candidatus Nomurabacteria bacterium]
ILYSVGVQKANCLAFVGIRKSGIFFASKQNDEERSAKLFCDDKKVFVEEIPGTMNRFTCVGIRMAKGYFR